ncbi:MAG TPA: hypothetical protein VHK69_11525 [Chitinophagaceae bacterium]|nr:hypothetical protein [Chitinophagaceae bacterium]
MAGLLLSGVLFFSCSKEQGPLAPGTYRKQGLETVGKLRVFARTGEITDPALLLRFTERDAPAIENFKDRFYPDTGLFGSFTIHQSERATVSHDFRQQEYLLQHKEDLVTFTAADTLYGGTVDEVFTRTPEYNILRYKPPVYAENLYATNGGVFYFNYTSRIQMYLERDRSRLQSGAMTAVIHRPNASYLKIWQNRLNPGFYSSLNEGDTVVVQEYSVLYGR